MAKLANLAKSVFEKIVYMIRAVESSEYGKNGKFCKKAKKKKERMSIIPKPVMVG